MLDRQLSLRTGAAVLVVSLLVLAGVVAFLLGGDTGPPTQGSPLPTPAGTVPDAAMADYAGDQVCAACHPAIFATHHRSRHTATLHPMLAGHLPVPFPDHARFTDRATGLQYALERRGDRYLFQVLNAGEAAPVEFAFGSGKTGITLVGSGEGDAIREFRMSYFPSRHRWEVTPGQRGTPADPLGRRPDRATAQRCFGCHSTVIAASQVIPEPRFMGVGCEACHGPGRRHIEALQHGDPTPHIDNPGRWDGERVNALCGRCHRSQEELDPLDTFSLAQTQRFQPLGLAKSACFRESAGRLSCVTCHDAHEDANLDSSHYEAVCLSCHGAKAGAPAYSVFRSAYPAKSKAGPPLSDTKHEIRTTPEPPTPDPQPPTPGRVCPVNPRSGCIACHMPNREVVRGITMADHWIRVVRSAAAGDRQR
jgi:cytochrome c554/c'-like protein